MPESKSSKLYAIPQSTPAVHAFDAAKEADNKDIMDIDRILANISNFGTIAALVGGFALGNLKTVAPEDDNFLTIAIYLSSFIATHASSCAALTSVLLFSALNGMHSEDASDWVRKWGFVLKLPQTKSVMGIVAYLFSVLLIGWRDLETNSMAQKLGLGIGFMSVSAVICTTSFVAFTTSKKTNYNKPKDT